MSASLCDHDVPGDTPVPKEPENPLRVACLALETIFLASFSLFSGKEQKRDPTVTRTVGSPARVRSRLG